MILLIIIICALAGGGKPPKLAIKNCKGPLKEDASKSKTAAYAACLRLNTGALASFKKSSETYYKGKKEGKAWIKK